jgi:hypothetical protein
VIFLQVVVIQRLIFFGLVLFAVALVLEIQSAPSMHEKDKNEELIYKLIEKRKQENDAFTKLLNAMGSKPAEATDKPPAGDRKKT